MTANPVTVAPTTEAGAVEQASGIGSGARLLRRIVLGLAVLLVLFVGTFTLAWFRANTLATTYLADADRSYDQGNYVEALTGYEEFDQATNTYKTRGGYMKVAKIWADPNAWPRPAGLDRANTRIDEILNQRMTIEDAEGFIQANTGRTNPYMGVVFLRLGELYEEEGDERSAEDIYEEIPELFPNEPDLIKRAEEHLARLDQ